MSDEADKRHTQVANIMPVEWDRHAFGLASEVRTFLRSIADEGTEIDSGGGDGTGDLWVTVQGVEYFVSIRKSNRQLLREGKPLPSI